MKKRLASIILVLLLSFTLTGCKEKKVQTESTPIIDTTTTTPPVTATTSNDDDEIDYEKIKTEKLQEIKGIFDSEYSDDLSDSLKTWLNERYQEEINVIEKLSNELLDDYTSLKFQNDIQDKKNEIVEEPITLSIIYDKIKDLELDSKGSAMGELVTITLTCNARVEQSVLYFNDETRVIKIHGIKDDKLWNHCQVGSVYEITGNIAMYKYQAQIDNVTPERIKKVDAASQVCTKKQVNAEDVFNSTINDLSLYGYLLEVKGYFYADNQDSSKEIFVISNQDAKKHLESGCYIGIYSKNYDDLSLIKSFESYEYGQEVTVTMTLYDTFNDHSKTFIRAYFYTN